MDDCDLGSRHEEYFRRRAIDEIRGRKSFRVSRTDCIDCGEPLPEARRRVQPGCCRCVNCQTAYEEAGT